jgi:hypothetical protein
VEFSADENVSASLWTLVNANMLQSHTSLTLWKCSIVTSGRSPVVRSVFNLS